MIDEKEGYVPVRMLHPEGTGTPSCARCNRAAPYRYAWVSTMADGPDPHTAVPYCSLKCFAEAQG